MVAVQCTVCGKKDEVVQTDIMIINGQIPQDRPWYKSKQGLYYCNSCNYPKKIIIFF